MFLLHAVYHTFIVRSPALPRNKGQMYGKFKKKLYWLPFIFAKLFIFCSFWAGRRKKFDCILTLDNSGNFWSKISYKSRCFIGVFLLSYCSILPNQQLKTRSILQIFVSELFGFIFCYMKRSSQSYKRPITNYYSMPLSKIIWISPIISVSQTFLSDEKCHCPTQSQHRLF